MDSDDIREVSIALVVGIVFMFGMSTCSNLAVEESKIRAEVIKIKQEKCND